LQDYGVWLSASMEFVIFTRGNDDAGTLGLRHALHSARVVESWNLRRFGMAACLQNVMAEHEPNQRGLT